MCLTKCLYVWVLVCESIYFLFCPYICLCVCLFPWQPLALSQVGEDKKYISNWTNVIEIISQKVNLLTVSVHNYYVYLSDWVRPRFSDSLTSAWMLGIQLKPFLMLSVLKNLLRTLVIIALLQRLTHFWTFVKNKIQQSSCVIITIIWYKKMASNQLSDWDYLL